MKVRCPRCDGEGSVELTPRVVFGINVKRLRSAMHLTQEELAAKIPGVGRAQVANIESGRSATPIDKLPGFTEALDCSFDDLLCAHAALDTGEGRP